MAKLLTTLKTRMIKAWKDDGEITLSGNVGSEPRLGETPRGKKFAHYRVAIDQGRSTIWVDLRLFGPSADWAFGCDRDGNTFKDGKPLMSGDAITIRGSYRRGPWKKRDGSEEMRHQVSVFKRDSIKREKPRQDHRDWSALA